MKTIYKLGLVFVLAMLTSSCSSNENSLTKSYVLEQLKTCEEERPNINSFYIKTKGFRYKYNANTSINDRIIIEQNHLMQLIDQGYLKRDSISAVTNYSDPKNNFSINNIIIPEKSEQYIIKYEDNEYVSFNALEINAFDVEDIKTINEYLAEVTVVYKKHKSPFYNSELHEPFSKDKADTITKVVSFTKNKANDFVWTCRCPKGI